MVNKQFENDLKTLQNLIKKYNIMDYDNMEYAIDTITYDSDIDELIAKFKEIEV